MDKKSREHKKTSGKKHISQFKEEFEFIPLLVKHGETRNSCTNFGRKFLDWINSETGRIHTSYSQIKNTGRVSSRAPNLQNIPSC